MLNLEVSPQAMLFGAGCLALVVELARILF